MLRRERQWERVRRGRKEVHQSRRCEELVQLSEDGCLVWREVLVDS